MACMQGNASSKLTKEQMFEKAEWFIEHSGFYGHFTEESKDFLDKEFVFRGPGVHWSPSTAVVHFCMTTSCLGVVKQSTRPIALHALARLICTESQ